MRRWISIIPLSSEREADDRDMQIQVACQDREALPRLVFPPERTSLHSEKHTEAHACLPVQGSAYVTSRAIGREVMQPP